MTDRSSARTRRLLAVLVLFALPLLGAACSDDDDPDDTSSETSDDTSDTAGDGGAEPDITLTEFEYSDLSVGAGDDVVIQNDTSAPHTFTADDDSFDSGEFAGGAQGTVTAPSEAGDYPFHCEIHPNMTGTLTVE